ncbi:MAG: hypothetical protein K6G18_13905 [Treponema sp.]|nr:hypothetical protein [Treponema sp.]
MEENYQKLFDEYTARIDDFIALIRKAVKGDDGAKKEIDAIILKENGGRKRAAYISGMGNVFEAILESVAKTREKTKLRELRDKTVAQMKEDFEAYTAGMEKMHDEYGDGWDELMNRAADPLFLETENREEYLRVCGISTLYPKLGDLEQKEHMVMLRERAEEEEKARSEKAAAGDGGDESGSGDDESNDTETVGDVLANIICAPLGALANGINWLADGINDITLNFPV